MALYVGHIGPKSMANYDTNVNTCIVAFVTFQSPIKWLTVFIEFLFMIFWEIIIQHCCSYFEGLLFLT